MNAIITNPETVIGAIGVIANVILLYKLGKVSAEIAKAQLEIDCYAAEHEIDE